MTVLDTDINGFVARLCARLAAGAATYGDQWFTRPASDLVDEVMQELEDVCGWSLLLWIRLDRLRGQVERVAGLEGKEEMVDHNVRIRSWVKGTERDRRAGLLGFVSVHYGDLVLDGIVLRRTSEGHYALSFPARTDRAGRKHSYIRPVDDDVRQEIEREILWQLGEREEFVP